MATGFRANRAALRACAQAQPCALEKLVHAKAEWPVPGLVKPIRIPSKSHAAVFVCSICRRIFRVGSGGEDLAALWLLFEAGQDPTFPAADRRG
jgi:hypothetical protein